MLSLGGAIITNGKHTTTAKRMIGILYELFYFITIPEFTDLCIVGVKEEYQSGAVVIVLEHNLNTSEMSLLKVLGLRQALKIDNNTTTNLFLFKNLTSAYDYLSDILIQGVLN